MTIIKTIKLLGHVTQMQPIATDVTHSVVCVSVCFGQTGELCKND